MSEAPPRRSYASLQGVNCTFAILDRLAEGQMTASEVCSSLGLSWTTAHRALASLEAQGALERNPESGAYRIGPRLYRLGLAYVRDHAVVHAAAGATRLLASELGVSAQLNERDGLQTSVLLAVDPKPEVIPKSTAEYRFPLNAGSNGQTILAFSSPDVFAALLGSGSVAAPLFDRRGELAGAICLIVELDQLDAREAELAAALLPSAQQASSALGWQPTKPPAALAWWESWEAIAIPF